MRVAAIVAVAVAVAVGSLAILAGRARACEEADDELAGLKARSELEWTGSWSRSTSSDVTSTP